MARARPQKSDSENGTRTKQKATYAIFGPAPDDSEVVGPYLGDMQGINAQQAARAYLKTLDPNEVAGSHDFVVIPRRNMSEVGLTVETSLKIS